MDADFTEQEAVDYLTALGFTCVPKSQQLNEAHMKNTHTVTLKITITDEHLWNHPSHWNWAEFLDLNPQLGETVEVVSRSHQCDKCGVMVPEDEYTGHDKPDGTSEYLCPDCPSDYGNE